MRRVVIVVFLAIGVVGLTGCPPPPEPPSTWIPIGTCFDGVDGAGGGNPPDLRYVGPENTVDNIVGHNSTDGTCSGQASPFPGGSFARADSLSEAQAICGSLGSPGNEGIAMDIRMTFLTLPSDAWACVFRL